MYDFIENLTWRGMIQDATPDVTTLLKKGSVKGYIGFDPTASSLHVGNLATIMLLKHFQLAGHKPIALVGGATGMVGDPSFKATERKFLDTATLLHNQTGVMKQLEKFLDFTPGPHAAELCNNIDWFNNLSFLTFLRETGKYISVNYMMAKEAVKRRLQTGDGISFTEFSYQLMQAYDFYHLYTTQGVPLQMGGADQWGNLTTGVELIRKKAGQEAFALTTPLITKADGSKFGKSETGNIWLDPALTSPYEFYQFWVNCTDEDAYRFIKIFTLLDQTTIENLIGKHQQVPHQRMVQKAIATELTSRVHSTAACKQAATIAGLLFEQASPNSLSQTDWLGLCQCIPMKSISFESFESINSITELIAHTGMSILFNSKSEIKRALQEGSLYINANKITNDKLDSKSLLLHNQYLLIQYGKKKHYVIQVQ